MSSRNIFIIHAIHSPIITRILRKIHRAFRERNDRVTRLSFQSILLLLLTKSLKFMRMRNRRFSTTRPKLSRLDSVSKRLSKRDFFSSCSFPFQGKKRFHETFFSSSSLSRRKWNRRVSSYFSLAPPYSDYIPLHSCMKRQCCRSLTYQLFPGNVTAVPRRPLFRGIIERLEADAHPPRILQCLSPVMSPRERTPQPRRREGEEEEEGHFSDPYRVVSDI